MKKRSLFLVLTGLSLALAGCPQAPPDRAGRADTPTLPSLLGAGRTEGYPTASEPRDFAFPADHGPHPAYRNEWWYLTGNLESAGGRRFGYELTLFRFRLAPASSGERGSRWAAEQAYVAHFAVTDAAAGEFHAAERYARGAAGLAGATADPVHVWLYDWSLRHRSQGSAGDTWQLYAADGPLGLELTLTPEREPVLHGDRGLSRKSAATGNASYYYSVPRLASVGRLATGGERFEVRGTSWLDREWSSSALGPEQQGWDWFALQLSDGSDLMFYQLRSKDGSRDPHSAGTFMPPDAATRHLAADDVAIEVLDRWESPAGGRYPVEWRLSVPEEALELRITPVLRNQELHTLVRYWEGAVDASGTRGGREVGGRGYVEMTGYAEALPRGE